MRITRRTFRFSGLLLFVGATRASAQVDYSRAEQFLSKNLSRLAFGTEVNPEWLPDSTRFWYRVTTPRGPQFLLVDPEKNVRRSLFDNAKLAAALSIAIDSAIEPTKLPISSLRFMAGDDRNVRFTVGKRELRCDIVAYRCISGAIPPDPGATAVRSPDGKWEVFGLKHNLYLRPAGCANPSAAGTCGDSIQLTTDGVFRFEYGFHSDAGAIFPGPKPAVKWSPDSRYIVADRPDYREVKLLMLYSSTTTRPKSREFGYALPEDSVIPRAEIHIIEIPTRRKTVVRAADGSPLWFGNHNVSGGQWSKTGDRFYVSNAARGGLSSSLYAVDAATGAARVVLVDSSGSARAGWRLVQSTGDIIMSSWRDGWLHFYLHGNDGTLKHRITTGPFTVRSILDLDEKNGTLFFTAHGREPGRFFYDDNVYRIKLDGSGLTLLTPEPGVHTVSFAPRGSYFVDRYSTHATGPITVLRSTSDGRVFRELERADVSRLATIGWKPPERFEALAADGITPVWGFIYKPTDFDSTKRYAVVDHIYPHGGVTAYRRTWGFSPTSYGEPRALAELGFIVIEMDGRGTWIPRTRSDRDTYYGDMGQNSLPDHVTALKQLGARHPWMDLTRVGIYGISGGGYASTAGMLRYPEFFKVGVSLAGNHDNRTYWWGYGEGYQGLVVRDPKTGKDNWDEEANVTYAKNLKGKLFLMHGDMDDNVHPAHTLRVVHALIAANKKFDFLLLPDRGHNLYEPYVIGLMWDYFVKHLAGLEPPKEYYFSEEKEE